MNNLGLALGLIGQIPGGCLQIMLPLGGLPAPNPAPNPALPQHHCRGCTCHAGVPNQPKRKIKDCLGHRPNKRRKRYVNEHCNRDTNARRPAPAKANIPVRNNEPKPVKREFRKKSGSSIGSPAEPVIKIEEVDNLESTEPIERTGDPGYPCPWSSQRLKQRKQRR